MPFDGQSDPSPTDALARFQEQPTLKRLNFALLHPGVWPRGFVWDYSAWDGCVLALASKLWPDAIKLPDHIDDLVGISIAAGAFGIPFRVADYIFLEIRAPRRWFVPFWRRPMKETFPEHVAAAIEKYLATTA